MNIKALGIKADMYLSASSIFSSHDGKADVIFFPGCSLSAYNPEYIFSVRDFIQEHEGIKCGIISSCCAKPLKLMGDNDTFMKRIEALRLKLDETEAHTIITACQNCYRVLREYDKDREILSLWPCMMKFGLPEELSGKYKGLEVCVHDSCVSTPEIIESVRKLLAFMGVKVLEFPDGVKCCGGIISITGTTEQAHNYMTRRADSSPCNTILSYCASCRSAMSINGTHKSIHILDLIYGNGEPCGKSSGLINRLRAAQKLKEE